MQVLRNGMQTQISNVKIFADNGTQLISEKVLRFLVNWEIDLVTSSPHYQQSNGKAESPVKIAKKTNTQIHE